MKKCVLIVNCDSEKCEVLREECRKYGAFVSIVMGLDEAVRELMETNSFLLIILLPRIMKEIQFPRKEFDLFCLLASNPGRVFINEQLYREIWGDEYIRSSDHGLNSCLRRIRRKLDEVPGEPCRIENRRGVGYCFMA